MLLSHAAICRQITMVMFAFFFYLKKQAETHKTAFGTQPQNFLLILIHARPPPTQTLNRLISQQLIESIRHTIDQSRAQDLLYSGMLLLQLLKFGQKI